MAEVKRIEIGFAGGQVAGIRVGEERLRELRDAIQRGGGGWHEIESEDGNLALDLDKVVFVRVEGGEHRIGFSTK
jgi:hypothetical protein